MRNLALAAIAWFQLSMGVLTAAAQTSPRDEPTAAALLVSMEVNEVAAFDAEYGRLIVQKLTKAITDAAQPACVADNNLTPERLQGLVRDLLLVGSSTLKEFYSRARDETMVCISHLFSR